MPLTFLFTSWWLIEYLTLSAGWLVSFFDEGHQLLVPLILWVAPGSGLWLWLLGRAWLSRITLDLCWIYLFGFGIWGSPFLSSSLPWAWILSTRWINGSISALVLLCDSSGDRRSNEATPLHGTPQLLGKFLLFLSRIEIDFGGSGLPSGVSG